MYYIVVRLCAVKQKKPPSDISEGGKVAGILLRLAGSEQPDFGKSLTGFFRLGC